MKKLFSILLITLSLCSCGALETHKYYNVTWDYDYNCHYYNVHYDNGKDIAVYTSRTFYVLVDEYPIIDNETVYSELIISGRVNEPTLSLYVYLTR